MFPTSFAGSRRQRGSRPSPLSFLPRVRLAAPFRWRTVSTSRSSPSQWGMAPLEGWPVASMRPSSSRWRWSTRRRTTEEYSDCSEGRQESFPRRWGRVPEAVSLQLVSHGLQRGGYVFSYLMKTLGIDLDMDKAGCRSIVWVGAEPVTLD